MANASETLQLLTDYYAAYGDGGPEGLARMGAFYAEGKTNYTAGTSELSGTVESPEASLQYLHRLLDLNDNRIEILGTPTILLAGDAMVAVLLKEKHHGVGQPELIIPRLCVYEIETGKVTKSFIWQLESEAFDAYYPRA